MLYIVATPIGHLGDITYRAVDTLKKSDYILCEDTRHSIPLLKAYDISIPLRSYHKFNEAKTIAHIIKDLKEGSTISLISDAGTPGLCDPGEKLIKHCIEEAIPFSVIPGACAVIPAFILSGFSGKLFQFAGFLPKQETLIKKMFEKNRYYEGTTIYYESPNRLLKTLSLLMAIDPNIMVAIAKEITKIHETCIRGSALECYQYFLNHRPRGEIVLMVYGQKETPPCLTMSLEEHMALLKSSEGLSQKEAIKKIALQRNLPKRDVYNYFHQKVSS
jgi:16S rRNA (cytidine1402-2'-O)-methyltransferase